MSRSMNQMKRFRVSDANKDYVNMDGSIIVTRPKTSGTKPGWIKVEKRKDLFNSLNSTNPSKFTK